MKWLKKYSLFKESIEGIKEEKIKPIKDPIGDICVSMLLLNNEFLDNLLDRGLKARYSENSQVFITDLKNMLLAKNRLRLGKVDGDKFVADTETSKINKIFESIDFDIERDWKKLNNYRILSRSIIDKLIPDQKLTEDLIQNIFWNIERTKDHSEDIVIELKDGRQFSFYLNKNLSGSKSASFNTFADDLIGNAIDKLYNEEYIRKWDKLAQDWIKIIYENANKNFQIHIEKFIDPKRIDSIGWFELFEIKHRDPRYKVLGEHIKEFDKNILNLSDLLSEIWKDREKCFLDVERVYNEWMEKKIFILNSKILEHILTESLTESNLNDIRKLADGYKLAGGTVKMKLMKTVVEKLSCMERPVYYLGNNGSTFHQVPPRQFFRDYYDDMRIKFDYHVKMVVDEEEEENNDFNIRMILELDGDILMKINIAVKFSGKEMSGKLTSKYTFEPVDNFNVLVSSKIKGFSNED